MSKWNNVPKEERIRICIYFIDEHARYGGPEGAVHGMEAVKKTELFATLDKVAQAFIAGYAVGWHQSARPVRATPAIVEPVATLPVGEEVEF